VHRLPQELDNHSTLSSRFSKLIFAQTPGHATSIELTCNLSQSTSNSPSYNLHLLWARSYKKPMIGLSSLLSIETSYFVPGRGRDRAPSRSRSDTTGLSRFPSLHRFSSCENNPSFFRFSHSKLVQSCTDASNLA